MEGKQTKGLLYEAMTKIHREISSDMLIVLNWIIIAFVFIVTPSLEKSLYRTILGMPLILFIPGYASVLTLFPKKDDLESIERMVLSVGVSLVVVSLLGLMLNFTFGIRLIPILMTLCLYSVILMFIANYRRKQLPEDLRFDIQFYKIYETIKIEINDQRITDKILTIALLLGIIVAVGALVYVINVPKIGERFTEFYILNSTSGKADNYPTRLDADLPTTLLVGIVNHEYSAVNYTMQVDIDKNILTTEKMTLVNNQTWEKNISLLSDKNGTDMKLEFLLFRDNNFTIPYRELHLWMNKT